jgi:hypothetical protein
MLNVVYVIQNKHVPNQFKIGITGNWQQRAKQLKVGVLTNEIHVGYVVHNHQLEKQLHKRYAQHRLPQSEWFHLSDEQVANVIKTIDLNSIRNVKRPVVDEEVVVAAKPQRTNKRMQTLIPEHAFWIGIIAAFYVVFFNVSPQPNQTQQAPAQQVQVK